MKIFFVSFSFEVGKKRFLKEEYFVSPRASTVKKHIKESYYNPIIMVCDSNSLPKLPVNIIY